MFNAFLQTIDSQTHQFFFADKAEAMMPLSNFMNGTESEVNGKTRIRDNCNMNDLFMRSFLKGSSRDDKERERKTVERDFNFSTSMMPNLVLIILMHFYIINYD